MKIIAQLSLALLLLGIVSGCAAHMTTYQLVDEEISSIRLEANDGDPAAQYNLGLIYYQGIKNAGISQNYKQALYWYIKSAEQGYAAAQNDLSTMYLKGEGISQDYKQTIYWATKAAEQGFAQAQAILGSLYYSGEGILQDYKQAFYWTSKAAKQGGFKFQVQL